MANTLNPFDYSLLKKWKVNIISLVGCIGSGKSVLVKKILDSIETNVSFIENKSDLEGFLETNDQNGKCIVIQDVCSDWFFSDKIGIKTVLAAKTRNFVIIIEVSTYKVLTPLMRANIELNFIHVPRLKNDLKTIWDRFFSSSDYFKDFLSFEAYCSHLSTSIFLISGNVVNDYGSFWTSPFIRSHPFKTLSTFDKVENEITSPNDEIVEELKQCLARASMLLEKLSISK